jgi:hypothetical protein
MEELHTFMPTFVTDVTNDFKVTRVTLFARFNSVHNTAVTTCVTEVTKLPVFTTDPFRTMVTLLTTFLGQQSNHGREGNHEIRQKVKCTLVQALRLCTGHTAHRGSRGIALPFLDHGIRRG